MSIISDTLEIDFFCKYKLGHILVINREFYHCILNKTVTKRNIPINKFIVMQIIVTFDKKYIVFKRCNIIDSNDKIFHKECEKEKYAISLFEKIFKQKTENNWDERYHFVPKIKKYQLSNDFIYDTMSITLDKKIHHLFELLTSFDCIEMVLLYHNINIKKLHPFKINHKRIAKAYHLINHILKNLDHPQLLNSLSIKYDKLIPKTYSIQSPVLIYNTRIIEKNINILNDLFYLSYALKEIYLLQRGISYDNLYHRMNTIIKPLSEEDNMYFIINKYIQNTNSIDHHLDIRIMDIYHIDRNFERNIYLLHSKSLENKTLLFHGLVLTNLIGVFQHGLINPKFHFKMNYEGKIFGQGIYFTNCSSKCVKDCMYYLTNHLVCFFIAEVALGNILEQNVPDVSLSKNLPKEYQSVKGIGQNTIKNYILCDNIQIPNEFQRDTICFSKTDKYQLLYDEYVVYHEEQVNLKYLVMAKIIDHEDVIK